MVNLSLCLIDSGKLDKARLYFEKLRKIKKDFDEKGERSL